MWNLVLKNKYRNVKQVLFEGGSKCEVGGKRSKGRELTMVDVFYTHV
jgi:hypothetical protein